MNRFIVSLIQRFAMRRGAEAPLRQKNRCVAVAGNGCDWYFSVVGA